MVLYLALVLAADLLHEAPAILCVYRSLSLSFANLRILLYAPLMRARPDYVCGFRLITGGALCRLRHDFINPRVKRERTEARRGITLT